MSSPTLSFCIATLNRGNIIGETLDSILNQLDPEQRQQVEIVIVDGASADNTQEVIKQYQTRFENIVYVRLLQKGGVDRDYTEAVKHASGDYCWLMSDDDILKPGAIAAVFAAIQERHELIIVNAEVKNNDFTRQIAPSMLAQTSNRTYPQDEYEDFFVNTASYMSFIGCVVIKRNRWNERPAEPYFGSEFVHIGVIFQQPLPGTVLVIATPFITVRYNNASWTSRYFEIWMFKWPNLIWSFNHYSELSRQHITPKEPWRSSIILMVNRARGSYSDKEYHKFLASRLDRSKSRLMSYLIAIIPGWLLNILFLSYFKYLKPHDVLGIEDMRNSTYYLPRYLYNFRHPAQIR